MTAVKIVNASALAAVLFAEPDGIDIAKNLATGDLFAPTLLGYEIANVCLRKLRANPRQRREFIAAFANWSAMGIQLVPVEHAVVLALAEQFRLTAYDASYLWLALTLGAQLVTLDRRLARAAVQVGAG